MPSNSREYMRRYYQEHKSVWSEYGKTHKEQQRKVATEWRAKHPDKIRGYRQKYKLKSNLYGREYHRRNRDTLIPKMKLYKLKNRDSILARRREEYARRPELFRKRSLLWAKCHPEKRSEIQARRRARKLNASVGTDRAAYTSFFKMVHSATKIRCYWCGQLVPKISRELDHIIPISKGGRDSVHNLCCACSACNLKKKDKMPEVFAGQHQLPLGGEL